MIDILLNLREVLQYVTGNCIVYKYIILAILAILAITSYVGEVLQYLAGNCKRGAVCNCI